MQSYYWFSSQDATIAIPNPEPENKILVEAELVYSATASQVKFLAQFSGLGLDVNEFKYDVDIYKVSYITTYKGSEITASGLIVLPKTTEEVAYVKFSARNHYASQRCPL